MPNPVHLLLTPTHPQVESATASLSRSVGEAHRRYTGFVNARARTTGRLFQGRCGSGRDLKSSNRYWTAPLG